MEHGHSKQSDGEEYEELVRNYHDLCEAVRMVREAVETTFGNNLLPDAARSETPVHECEMIARAIYAAGRLPSKARGSQKLAVFMRHRNVDYIVEEIEPGRWRWKFCSPRWDGRLLISQTTFRTREAAVEACHDEINNALERSRPVAQRF